MFTLEKLCSAKLLTAWQLPGDEVPQRLCYTTSRWKLDMQALKKNPSEGGIRPFVSSPYDEIKGLLDDFVRGVPPVRLIRPRGEGMDPPFRRMDPPHGAVVEMRTPKTRCFGFFHRPDVLVLHLAVAVERLKTNRRANREYYGLAAAAVGEHLLARLLETEWDANTDVDRLVQ
jgi:hypothetical protein